MRWDTENYNPGPHRINKMTIFALVVLVIAVLAVVVIAPTLVPPTPPTEYPGNIICPNTGQNCFSYQLSSDETNNNTFNLNWKFSDGSFYNNSASSPNIEPLRIGVDSVSGMMGMQIRAIGSSFLNLTIITVIDLGEYGNATGTRLTYACKYAGCEVSIRFLYFDLIGYSINATHIYQFSFKSSGNLSVWQVRFHV